MLYASRSAQRKWMSTGRIWLVAGYAVAAVLLVAVAVAACRAQADRVGDELTGAVARPSPTMQSAVPGSGGLGGDPGGGAPSGGGGEYPVQLRYQWVRPVLDLDEGFVDKPVSEELILDFAGPGEATV